MEVEMEEDEEFLSQVAAAEAHALCMSSTKRRKVTKTNSSISLTKTKPSVDGLYTVALKGAIVKWSCEDSILEKQCPCGVGACVVFTANPGRKFYKCPLSLGQVSTFLFQNGGCGSITKSCAKGEIRKIAISFQSKT